MVFDNNRLFQLYIWLCNDVFCCEYSSHTSWPSFQHRLFSSNFVKVVSILIKYIHYSDRKLFHVLKERYKLFWYEAIHCICRKLPRNILSKVISNWFSVITSLPTLEQLFPDWNTPNQPSLIPTQELTNDSIVFFSNDRQTRTSFWYYNVFAFWQWVLHSSDYFVS